MQESRAEVKNNLGNIEARLLNELRVMHLQIPIPTVRSDKNIRNRAFDKRDRPDRSGPVNTRVKSVRVKSDNHSVDTVENERK